MSLWELWAEMIRSDQMEPAEVVRFLNDYPDFTKWYRETFQ
jgi:hypothetical protein